MRREGAAAQMLPLLLLWRDKTRCRSDGASSRVTLTAHCCATRPSRVPRCTRGTTAPTFQRASSTGIQRVPGNRVLRNRAQYAEETCP